MDPMGMNLAIELTRRHVLSALPQAPVVPDPPKRPSRPPRTDPLRLAAAVALRHVAERVEPRRGDLSDTDGCQPALL